MPDKIWRKKEQSKDAPAATELRIGKQTDHENAYPFDAKQSPHAA